MNLFTRFFGCSNPQRFEIAAQQHKEQGNDQADRNSDQQVRPDNCHNRDDKRQELSPTLAIHRLELRRMSQFIAHDKQDRSEAGQRNQVQDMGNRNHTTNQKDPVNKSC